MQPHVIRLTYSTPNICLDLYKINNGFSILYDIRASKIEDSLFDKDMNKFNLSYNGDHEMSIDYRTNLIGEILYRVKMNIFVFYNARLVFEPHVVIKSIVPLPLNSFKQVRMP